MLHSAPTRRRGLEDCVRRTVCVSECCFPLQSSPVYADMMDGRQTENTKKTKDVWMDDIRMAYKQKQSNAIRN